MTNRLSIVVFLAAIALCGCQTQPTKTSSIRPEIKLIDFTDVQRLNLVVSKTQFRSSDTIAVCVLGFSGRTVTIELWEQKRGLVNKKTQMIHPPHVQSAPGGVGYDYSVGYVPSGGPRYERQIENVHVVPLRQMPAGVYEVRVSSNDGIYLQSSFTVSS